MSQTCPFAVFIGPGESESVFRFIEVGRVEKEDSILNKEWRPLADLMFHPRIRRRLAFLVDTRSILKVFLTWVRVSQVFCTGLDPTALQERTNTPRSNDKQKSVQKGPLLPEFLCSN